MSRILKNSLVALAAAFCIGLSAATITGAYGGYVDPARSVIPAIACMAFPYLALLTFVVMVANIFWNKWLAGLGAATLLVCIGPVLNASPLHFSTVDAKGVGASTDTFSVMTFNTYFFNSYKSVDLDSLATDQTAAAILDADPSIVVMQEAVPYDPFEMGRGKVSPALGAAIRARYPFRSFQGSTMAILSKFPFKRTLKHFDSKGEQSFMLDTYDVSIGDSTLHLVNVHLQSLMIAKQDLGFAISVRNLFTKTEARSAARHMLLPKIAMAFRKRARQARLVRQVVDSMSPGPIVLCGDFNDVPGCYAIRTIEGSTLRDCYADAGFGPSVTYRSNHLYFRIDHMLYGGDIRPLVSRRIDGGGSDHYPLYTLFAFGR